MLQQMCTTLLSPIYKLVHCIWRMGQRVTKSMMKQIVNFFAIRLTLVVTSPQTQCVVFVRQPLQTQTVGTIHHCQIIRSRSASSEATKHYAREVTIAYLKPTKSIVLSGTFPILTKDYKRAGKRT